MVPFDTSGVWYIRSIMSRNTVLVLILILAALISVSTAYYRTVIQQDFQVTNIEPAPASGTGG